jgi:hypothetical protein
VRVEEGALVLHEGGDGGADDAAEDAEVLVHHADVLVEGLAVAAPGAVRSEEAARRVRQRVRRELGVAQLHAGDHRQQREGHEHEAGVVQGVHGHGDNEARCRAKPRAHCGADARLQRQLSG